MNIILSFYIFTANQFLLRIQSQTIQFFFIPLLSFMLIGYFCLLLRYCDLLNIKYCKTKWKLQEVNVS